MMIFGNSDTLSMIRDSAIEGILVSISIFWAVTLASDMLLRRRVLSDGSVSIS